MVLLRYLIFEKTLIIGKMKIVLIIWTGAHGFHNSLHFSLVRYLWVARLMFAWLNFLRRPFRLGNQVGKCCLNEAIYTACVMLQQYRMLLFSCFVPFHSRKKYLTKGCLFRQDRESSSYVSHCGVTGDNKSRPTDVHRWLSLSLSATLLLLQCWMYILNNSWMGHLHEFESHSSDWAS